MQVLITCKGILIAVRFPAQQALRHSLDSFRAAFAFIPRVGKVIVILFQIFVCVGGGEVRVANNFVIGANILVLLPDLIELACKLSHGGSAFVDSLMTNAVVKQAESILVVEIGLLLQGEIIFIAVLTTPRAEELHIDGNTALIVVVCK